MLALRLPTLQKKVEVELGKARLEIEKSLVPQGPNVTRHLSLPEQGQTPEWILEEMAKMDAETDHASAWKQGKMSGAVYRAHHYTYTHALQQ